MMTLTTLLAATFGLWLVIEAADYLLGRILYGNWNGM